MYRFTHPTQQLCCGIVCSSYYISRLLYEAVGFWHCQNETEIMWYHMSSSWSKGFLVSHVCLFSLEEGLKPMVQERWVGQHREGQGVSAFAPNISAVLLHFWRLVSECFCTSQMQRELIFSSKTKTETQSKTLQQLFFNANACLFHALKPFSPGCLWQTFHNRLFKVWHMCHC